MTITLNKTVHGVYSILIREIKYEDLFWEVEKKLNKRTTYNFQVAFIIKTSLFAIQKCIINTQLFKKLKFNVK